MLENAIYSVISPEGCASILWRDPSKSLQAAEAMKLTAKDLLNLKIIDEIIPEPLGGAHRDKDLILDNIKNSISRHLDNYKSMTPDEIFTERKNKFLRIGRNKGFINNIEDLSSLKPENDKILQILDNKKTLVISGLILLALIFLFSYLY